MWQDKSSAKLFGQQSAKYLFAHGEVPAQASVVTNIFCSCETPLI
jgi:hypothetical protein